MSNSRIFPNIFMLSKSKAQLAITIKKIEKKPLRAYFIIKLINLIEQRDYLCTLKLRLPLFAKSDDKQYLGKVIGKKEIENL